MIQLKIKTEYSFGQTFAPINHVIKRLKEIGCTAAGIVDSSTWGHVVWNNACREADIQPLFGVSCIVSDDDLVKRMWFLAKNTEGLKELYRTTSESYKQKITTKFGHLPRLFTTDIKLMSDNIFKFAGDILDVDFLLDVGAYMDINPSSFIMNSKKISLAKKYDIKIVETSDNSFVYPSDKKNFELSSKSGLKVTPQYIIEKLNYQDNASEIAFECKNIEIPIAPMVRAEGDLEKLCRDGIKFRNMEAKWTKEYEDRLNYEIDLIKSKDYESYFIIVADMVHYAKEIMLVGPSRGSAAGSLVCYLSRITEIDPIPPKLFFERFIDVSRTDLPDIDLDFPDEKRHLIFEYMAKKYGENNVSKIGTVGRYKPRSALAQVCKAAGIAPYEADGVKVAMIERSGADSRATNCLEDTFTSTDSGREFIKKFPEALSAINLEGHTSHAGVHAAGLLVCNDEITNYATVDDEGIAHVEKISAEKLGLLKIDVLGLRTLGILEDIPVKIDWYNLPFNDEATIDIFRSGRLCGIFQFEGNALRSITSQITIDSLTDIDAVTALARPGPFGGGVAQEYIARKNGKSFKGLHPLVQEFMQETFGLPVYQEQTLAIVKYIGKFDWKETSTIRKAMSKIMGAEFFNKYWEKFKIGAMSQGIEEAEAHKIWEMINAMGSWQMNKAHTYSYAVISYWTAYLKAHHPLEFAASNLRHAKDDESAIELLREITREGYKYVYFDIEKSELNWCVKDGILYGGFKALKGIGDKKAETLIQARNSKTLTHKQIETINNAECPYKNIFPFHEFYNDYYEHPEKHGIRGEVVEIKDLDNVLHKHQRVFLGELIYKNARNANEAVNIKRRGGRIETGQLEYADLRLRDDSGMIGGRISKWDYLEIGRDLIENIPIGTHLMVRATFYNNIKYAFINKWKVIKKDG